MIDASRRDVFLILLIPSFLVPSGLQCDRAGWIFLFRPVGLLDPKAC
jgi:hypothetical protein